MIGWLTFGLAVASIMLWGLLIVTAALLFVRVRPIVRSYAPLVTAMMPATAAGTDEAGTPSPAAAVSKQAPADWCSYDDHQWSDPFRVAGEAPSHYCVTCGYIEPLPGGVA